MARTPSSSKPNHSQHTHAKTPQSKHRLHFGAPKIAHPSPNPKETPSAEHPVEVIGRIRDFPDRREKPISALQINRDRGTVRIRADFGYRDFSLDGVSLSEEEDLEGFYKKFVQSRIQGVKLGDKCTIMMYGPTGSGKSHTMFGCSKLPGIVYRSLMDILGEGGEENDGNPRLGTFVQVTVLEIYNEEIYDLLSSNGGGGGVGLGLPKGSASKVRLEVMGKKAKNATFISGTEAGKISKEIQKVEKRRIVKSTLCNERSSRSHCMIILDVPTVGGRLMLVDMAGSENIDQAGQVGFEAKQQTAKINQGNVSLKRVVESIANGDSHVPFRDSKLTMLLQDSFEDDKSKILMILCVSPDPKEIHKTSSTLEYGAKAKCIVRGPHTPTKGKIGSEDASTVILGSRIAAMDQFIYKLQMENKERERERNEAQKQLSKREEEVSQLRAKIEVMGGKGIIGSSEEEINSKVNERTQFLKSELERKLKECQKMADEFVELSRKRMEEKIVQQQLEVEMLRRRLEEIESEVSRPRDHNSEGNVPRNGDGISFAEKLLDIYGDEDPGMVKSMDLDTGEQESSAHGTMHGFGNQRCANYPQLKALKDKEDYDVLAPKYSGRVGLSTVFEEEEVEEKEEYMEKSEVEEVKKEMIEEKTVFGSQPPQNIAVLTPHLSSRSPENIDYAKDTASSRRTRIQNIFTLCGNYRELSQHISTPVPPKRSHKTHDPRSSPVKLFSDENSPAEKVPPSLEPFPLVKTLNAEQLTGVPQMRNEVTDVNSIEVCVKWEASNQAPGKFITTLRVVKDSSLSDLRKLIEIDLGVDNQAFAFLVLGDTNGVLVPREREANIKASELPIFNNQSCSHLVCLRPAKGSQRPSDLPLSPLENRLLFTPNHCFTQQTDCLSPKSAVSFSSTPYITVRRH